MDGSLCQQTGVTIPSLGVHFAHTSLHRPLDPVEHSHARSLSFLERAVVGGPNVTQVQKLREARLLAKVELARKAGVSESTIDRIEAGKGCRMETKRKILSALGVSLEEGPRVFRSVNLHRPNGKKAIR